MGIMLTVDEQLDQALARVASLEADAQAQETLLAESSTKAQQLEVQLEEAAANYQRLEADVSALRNTNQELESKMQALAVRNAEIEAKEQDIESRASKRAAEIVASTGTTAAVPVTAQGDQRGEDLVARFKAISDPKEQTVFWRSLTAQQQALILSSSSN